MRKNKGYTLIELGITLTISSLLLGYALPSFYQLKLNKYMDAERNRLSHSLHFARNYAVNHQIQVIVCSSLSANDCDNKSNWYEGWIVFTDSNRNRKFDGDDKLLQVEDAMMKDIKATSSLYRQKIRYNSMGFSPATNLSINFCDERGSEFAKSIILNNAGRIKQSKPISNNVCE